MNVQLFSGTVKLFRGTECTHMIVNHIILRDRSEDLLLMFSFVSPLKRAHITEHAFTQPISPAPWIQS